MFFFIEAAEAVAPALPPIGGNANNTYILIVTTGTVVVSIITAISQWHNSQKTNAIATKTDAIGARTEAIRVKTESIGKKADAIDEKTDAIGEKADTAHEKAAEAKGVMEELSIKVDGRLTKLLESMAATSDVKELAARAKGILEGRVLQKAESDAEKVAIMESSQGSTVTQINGKQ